MNNCRHDYLDVTFEMLKATEASEYGAADDARYHYCCRKCLRIVSVNTPFNEPKRLGEKL